MVGRAAHKGNIMTDKADGAFVVADRFFERFAPLNVEVGGRLVEQQEVGRVNEDAGEGEANFFTPAEHAGAFIDGLAGEAERAEQSAHISFRHSGVGRADNF